MASEGTSEGSVVVDHWAGVQQVPLPTPVLTGPAWGGGTAGTRGLSTQVRKWKHGGGRLPDSGRGSWIPLTLWGAQARCSLSWGLSVHPWGRIERGRIEFVSGLSREGRCCRKGTGRPG